MGTDNYPKTPAAACDVLCWYKKPTPPRQTHVPPRAVKIFHNEKTGSKKIPGNYGK